MKLIQIFTKEETNNWSKYNKYGIQMRKHTNMENTHHLLHEVKQETCKRNLVILLYICEVSKINKTGRGVRADSYNARDIVK